VSRVPKILIVVSEIPGIARDRGGQGWRKSPRPSWDEMDSSTKTSAMEMRLCLDVYERAAEDSLGALTEQRKPRELGESRSHDNQKNRTRTSGLDGGFRSIWGYFKVDQPSRGTMVRHRDARRA